MPEGLDNYQDKVFMGSKAEHLVTLIVVSKGGDADAGYYCYGHAARTNNRNGA